MRRKFLSVVLCVCMMLTMVPFAFAAEGGSSGGGGSGSNNAVAQIERTGKSYNTLQAAIDDAQRGDTITLQKSISANEIGSKKQLQFNEASMSLTLDLNNNVMTAEAGEAISINAANIDLTVKNGTIKNFAGGNYSDGLYAYKESNNLTLKFENVQLESRTQGLAVQGLTSNSNVTILNSKITSSQELGIYYPPKSGTLTITNSEVTGATGVVIKGSNLVVNGSQTIISGTGPNTDPETYYTGATDGSSQLTETGDAIYIESGYNDRDISVTISDGHFTSTHAQAVRMFIKNGEETSVKREVSLIGGTFSSDVSRYLTNDYIQNENGTVEALNESNAVAKIGDNLYTSLSAAISAASDGQTVTLLKNTTESVVIPATRNVIFDLNGNKLTAPTDKKYNAIVNYGTLTINDSKKTGEIISKRNSGIGIGANSNTTIVYANITGQEGAIGGYKDTVDATLTIDDGIFNGIDNAVVIFNGSERTGNANTITINSGTFNGGIQSEGYIACGIYAPWKDSITVNGGTFNITGGAGIVARAGTVTIAGGEFNTTGNTPGYVGDSKTTVPCSALVFDSRSDYPAKDTNSKISVQAGKFKSDVCTISFVNSDPSDTNTRLEVTGGYFTSDPTAYLATGKAAVESDLAGYNYKVANKSNAPATVAPAAPTVDINKLSDEQRETATQIANKLDSNAVTGDGLTAAANTIANNNTVSTNDGKSALESNHITTGTNSTRIVVQTYMDIDITAVDIASKTLTLDITPMYRTVATTANTDNAIKLTGDSVSDANAVPVGPAGKLTVSKPVIVKIPLPTNFATAGTSIYVQHKGYEYTAQVSEESSTLYATFTNPHGFSSFTITATPTAVAEVNGTSFINFQAAVDAVENGGTIKALKNIDSTVSGNKTFTVNANSNTVTLTAAYGYNMTSTPGDTTGITTYTVSHQSSGGPGSSGGSISTPTTYAVNVNAATNGAVAADKKTASKGTTVTVTASPSKGYVVDAVKVVDKDGKDVAVTEKDGKYVFTMPASAVTVTGSFKAETPAPAALPFTDVKSGSWFYDAVKYAYAQGLMTGTSATTFAPNGTMNRAMIVTVLYRLEKSPAVTVASKFTDVPAGQWYSDAVAWAAANKIVNGYDETTFGPMNAVTREQMAAILFRYEQVKGLENVTLEENLNRFPDQNKISAYAIPALQWAVGQKIINGNADGTLDPTGTATRAQVAQIFTNLLNK